MPNFTIFYSHPNYPYSGGSYTHSYLNAKNAGEDAVDMLPDDLIELDYPVIGVDGVDEDNYQACVEDYKSQAEYIKDHLRVRVYAGSHTIEPEMKPDWEFA